MFVAKYKQAHLKCKSGELLELVSNDGKNLGTFKQRKKRGDDEHEEENIGFVYMTSVTNVSLLFLSFFVADEIIKFSLQTARVTFQSAYPFFIQIQ